VLVDLEDFVVVFSLGFLEFEFRFTQRLLDLAVAWDLGG
jgi:hypothetical protein